MIKEKWKRMLLRVKKDFKEYKWAIIAVIAYFVLSGKLLGSVCPLVYMTGLPCPSCGLTRAGIAVLHLDFAKAMEMHPFIFAIGLWLLAAAYERYFQGKYRLSSWLKIAAGAMLVCLVLFYIYRMYVFFPDEPPMTYNYDNLLYYIWSLLKQ